MGLPLSGVGAGRGARDHGSGNPASRVARSSGRARHHDDGREGFVADTLAELPAGLSRLAADPALRAQMGARGRARALLFTSQAYAGKAIPFYERLMETAPREGS